MAADGSSSDPDRFPITKARPIALGILLRNLLPLHSEARGARAMLAN
jgi:hypothetical protein